MSSFLLKSALLLILAYLAGRGIGYLLSRKPADKPQPRPVPRFLDEPAEPAANESGPELTAAPVVDEPVAEAAPLPVTAAAPVTKPKPAAKAKPPVAPKPDLAVAEAVVAAPVIAEPIAAPPPKSKTTAKAKPVEPVVVKPPVPEPVVAPVVTAPAPKAETPKAKPKTAARARSELAFKVSPLAAMTVAEVEHAIEKAGAPAEPARLKGAEGGKPDALLDITGIGPVNEVQLHALGIYHFRQIAAWTPENIKWVAERIKFPTRIVRENWMKQAAEFEAAKK